MNKKNGSYLLINLLFMLFFLISLTASSETNQMINDNFDEVPRDSNENTENPNNQNAQMNINEMSDFIKKKSDFASKLDNPQNYNTQTETTSQGFNPETQNNTPSIEDGNNNTIGNNKARTKNKHFFEDPATNEGISHDTLDFIKNYGKNKNKQEKEKVTPKKVVLQNTDNSFDEEKFKKRQEETERIYQEMKMKKKSIFNSETKNQNGPGISDDLKKYIFDYAKKTGTNQPKTKRYQSRRKIRKPRVNKIHRENFQYKPPQKQMEIPKENRKIKIGDSDYVDSLIKNLGGKAGANFKKILEKLDTKKVLKRDQERRQKMMKDNADKKEILGFTKVDGPLPLLSMKYSNKDKYIEAEKIYKENENKVKPATQTEYFQNNIELKSQEANKIENTENLKESKENFENEKSLKNKINEQLNNFNNNSDGPKVNNFDNNSDEKTKTSNINNNHVEAKVNNQINNPVENIVNTKETQFQDSEIEGLKTKNLNENNNKVINSQSDKVNIPNLNPAKTQPKENNNIIDVPSQLDEPIRVVPSIDKISEINDKLNLGDEVEEKSDHTDNFFLHQNPSDIEKLNKIRNQYLKPTQSTEEPKAIKKPSIVIKKNKIPSPPVIPKPKKVTIKEKKEVLQIQPKSIEDLKDDIDMGIAEMNNGGVTNIISNNKKVKKSFENYNEFNSRKSKNPKKGNDHLNFSKNLKEKIPKIKKIHKSKSLSEENKSMEFNKISINGKINNNEIHKIHDNSDNLKYLDNQHSEINKLKDNGSEHKELFEKPAPKIKTPKKTHLTSEYSHHNQNRKKEKKEHHEEITENEGNYSNYSKKKYSENFKSKFNQKLPKLTSNSKKLNSKNNFKKEKKQAKFIDDDNDDFAKNVNHFKTQLDVDKMFDEDFLPDGKVDMVPKLGNNKKEDFKKEFEKKVQEKERKIKKEKSIVEHGKTISIHDEIMKQRQIKPKINKLKKIVKRTISVSKVPPKKIKIQKLRKIRIHKQIVMNPPKIKHLQHLAIQHTQKVKNSVNNESTKVIESNIKIKLNPIKKTKKIVVHYRPEHEKIIVNHQNLVTNIRINHKLKQRENEIMRNNRLKLYFSKNENSMIPTNKVDKATFNNYFSPQVPPPPKTFEEKAIDSINYKLQNQDYHPHPQIQRPRIIYIKEIPEETNNHEEIPAKEIHVIEITKPQENKKKENEVKVLQNLVKLNVFDNFVNKIEEAVPQQIHQDSTPSINQFESITKNVQENPDLIQSFLKEAHINPKKDEEKSRPKIDLDNILKKEFSSFIENFNPNI